MDEIPKPKLVQSRLKSSPALRGKPAEVEKLAKLIRHLKGIRFIVQVADKTTARLQFDFSEPVGPEAAYIKPVLIEFLQDAGAMLDDLQESTVELQKESVVL